MPTKQSQLDYVVVADMMLEDYGPLVVELSERGVRIGLFPTGEEALRAASGNAATLWVVNVRLPDMSGVALLKVVRRRLPRAAVFLVGDDYSADDERAARAAGATAYFCKPPSTMWLEAFQPHCRSTALAAGGSTAIPAPKHLQRGAAPAKRPP